MRLALLALPAFLAACAAPKVLPLQSAALPPTHQHTRPLEVTVRLSGGADPLPIRGTGLAFSQLVPALATSIADVTKPWARRHAPSSGEGWQLDVELVRTHAEQCHGTAKVELEARITLRAIAGQAYVAQTPAHCLRADADPRGAAYACIADLAHAVGGWMDGVLP